MTFTIHKHLLFTLRVRNTCNENIQNLGQGAKIFLKINWSIKLIKNILYGNIDGKEKEIA